VVQRLPVKIVLDQPQDPERPLRPGMSVEATVFTRSAPDRDPTPAGEAP
jgi:multidrug resistance efflux pump